MIKPSCDGILATTREVVRVKKNINDPLKLAQFPLWSNSTHILNWTFNLAEVSLDLD